MAILDALTLGSHISFDTYPASIIGTTFSNAKVEAILDFETASMFMDVAAMHANVYSTLPNGTLNDPKAYLYVKFRLENNKVTIIGVPWIKENTIALQSTVNMLITVIGVNPVDQSRFKDMCAANNFQIRINALE